MPLEKEKCLVGMLVQDTYGNVGTVRWIGRMEKAAKPPNKDVGTYAAVEFAEPNGKLTRTDGMWEGKRYCQSPPGTVEFHKPRALDPEMNQAGVVAIRSKFGDAVKDMPDVMIVKFLIARKFEIPKVITMMDDHFKWRAEYQPSMDEYFPPEMAQDYPVGFGDGVDREGNLLYFERPGNGGKSDPKDFVKKYGIPTICRWHTCGMETGVAKIRASSTARRVTTIIDLEKLGDSDKQVINFGKAIAKIDQDNYPEHLCKMYIINAPGMFTGIWKFVRLFIDDRTKAKIQVLGKDYRDVVTQQVEPKYWPTFMGGSDDSWLKNGGVMGSSDPARARDPETGALAMPEVTDAEIAAAAKAETPAAATPAAESPAASPAASP